MGDVYIPPAKRLTRLGEEIKTLLYGLIASQMEYMRGRYGMSHIPFSALPYHGFFGIGRNGVVNNPNNRWGAPPPAPPGSQSGASSAVLPGSGRAAQKEEKKE
jgi:hypothetical protein